MTSEPNLQLPASPEPTRRTRPSPSTVTLTALVALYVLIATGLAAAGRSTFVWKTSVVPALFLAALLTRRMRTFLHDWSVFLGAVVLFDSLRGFVFALITRFDLPWYALYVIQWERALLGGTTLPELLQSHRATSTIGTFERIMVIFHGSHFVFFLLFGLAIWLLRPEHFWRFRAAVLLVLGAGLLTYQAVPTVPPWMASQFGLLAPIDRMITRIYNLTTPTLLNTFDVNPIAAMPSLHAALPALLSLVALEHFRLRGLWILAYAFAVCFAIGYLGEHYLVDILAGIFLAIVVYFVVYRALPDRLQAARDAPLNGGPEPQSSALVRRLLVAFLLVLGADGLGQVTVALRRELNLSPEFVTRELLGHSELAYVFLARNALQKEDFAGATAALEAALTEIRQPRNAAKALQTLEALERRTSDSSVATEILERIPPEKRLLALVTKARMLFTEKKDREARDLLERLVREFPGAADPIYFLALYHLETGQINETEKLLRQLQTLAEKGNRRARYRAADLAAALGTARAERRKSTPPL